MGNKILTITKGHNSVVNLQTSTHNNANLDLVMVNAYAKFDQRKGNFDNNKGPNSVVNMR